MQFRAIAAALICICGFVGGAAAASTQGRVPILVYHRFDAATPRAMTVTTPVFVQQLAWLAEHHISVVSLHALVASLRDATPLPPAAVVLTADDGHRSIYTDMFPLLRRFRVPVTLFIYPSAISNADYALTWEQLAEMIESGLVDVQSHTYWHTNFRTERLRLSSSDYCDLVTKQLTLSKTRLQERLGIEVDLLAWPFGLYDADLERRAADSGYIAAFTLVRGPVRAGADLFALPRYLMTDQDRGARFAAIVLGAEEAGAAQ